MKSFEFMSAFNPEQNLVKEFDYWVILIRPEQITLGDCIFVLKREIASFAYMTKEESADLIVAIQWYENVCKELFGAEKFNYIAAMMRDNFAHFHAFPRYSKPVEIFNKMWIDERWPRVIQFSPIPNMTDNKVIIDCLKNANFGILKDN